MCYNNLYQKRRKAKRTAKGLFTWARLTGLARYILEWISPWVRLRVVPHFSSGRVERTKPERAWKSSPFLEWGDFHGRSRFVRCINIPEEKWVTTRSLALGSYEKFQPGLRDEKRPEILGKRSHTCPILSTRFQWTKPGVRRSLVEKWNRKFNRVE